jgi:hypothetical protein
LIDVYRLGLGFAAAVAVSLAAGVIGTRLRAVRLVVRDLSANLNSMKVAGIPGGSTTSRSSSTASTGRSSSRTSGPTTPHGLGARCSFRLAETCVVPGLGENRAAVRSEMSISPDGNRRS